MIWGALNLVIYAVISWWREFQSLRLFRRGSWRWFYAMWYHSSLTDAAWFVSCRKCPCSYRDPGSFSGSLGENFWNDLPKMESLGFHRWFGWPLLTQANTSTRIVYQIFLSILRRRSPGSLPTCCYHRKTCCCTSRKRRHTALAPDKKLAGLFLQTDGKFKLQFDLSKARLLWLFLALAEVIHVSFKDNMYRWKSKIWWTLSTMHIAKAEIDQFLFLFLPVSWQNLVLWPNFNAFWTTRSVWPSG